MSSLIVSSFVRTSSLLTSDCSFADDFLSGSFFVFCLSKSLLLFLSNSFINYKCVTIEQTKESSRVNKNRK